jgi:hypothetical protein
MTHDSKNPTREPKSDSVCSMTASAARCGAATASSRQRPTEARPLATMAAADGPGFGAGAMVGRNYTRHCPWALAGDDQETNAAAGTCGVS